VHNFRRTPIRPLPQRQPADTWPIAQNTGSWKGAGRNAAPAGDIALPPRIDRGLLFRNWRLDV